MDANRRKAYRRNAFAFGAILPAEGGEIGCLIWDATGEGAQIEVEDPATVPDRFRLRGPGEAAPRPARVAWRRERRLGLTFEG